MESQEPDMESKVSIRESIFAPDFQERPYWWELAEPESQENPLPSSADIAIIGGGYAGLSAALELARAGRQVVVLEADKFGAGASTRNGGAVIPGVKMHFPVGGTTTDDSWRRQLLDESLSAYDHFERVIRDENVPLYSGRIGRFVGAHSLAAFRNLVAHAKEMDRLSGDASLIVPHEQQRSELATDYYFGGVVSFVAGGVHPAAYHIALLNSCRTAGVILCSRAAVQAIDRSGDGFSLSTARGFVQAKNVVLATNGYTDKAVPWQRRRVIPIESHMIATEDIGEAAVQALMPSMRVYGDTKRVPCYFRPSPDRKRLLFGGRASFGELDLRSSAQRLYELATTILPGVRGARVTHAWKGKVAFTFDYMPHIGVHDGVHYCLGCNGAGVVAMSYLGVRIARKILQTDLSVSAFEMKPFQSRPLYWGAPWFLPIIGGYYRFRDRLDRIAA